MTNNNLLEEEIRQLVSNVTEVPFEKLTLDADFFKDLNIDSLKAIEIVAAFEKKYRIIIPEQDIPKIRNLRKIIEYKTSR
ncbi:MAG: acyl carrier protein [Nitrospirae bacterium]|nr:acyl carrier protein [Nitrospirota bacterium]